MCPGMGGILLLSDVKSLENQYYNYSYGGHNQRFFEAITKLVNFSPLAAGV